MTGNFNNPEVSGLNGMLDAYNQTNQNVKLSGPTLFSPVINYVKDRAKECVYKKVYNILLIITDGEIHDMTDTIKDLRESS